MRVRQDFKTILDESNVMTRLARFEPMVIGTPPLGIDIETSDIDIACTTDNLEQFKLDVMAMFEHEQGFEISNIEGLPDAAVRAAFISHDWEIELFCQTLPILEQWGVRHYFIEKRLLEILPGLKSKVIDLKRSGQNTEAAFATLLHLEGDPFAALLELESLSDEALAALAV